MTPEDDRSYTRRRLLKTGAGVATVGAATTLGGTATAQYEGYLEDEGTWGGQTADARGIENITIDVGAPGNTGNLAFAPVVILVQSGQTVRWRWTGEGGTHNVRHDADDPAFESELQSSAGATFEHTFEDPGRYPYLCDPHVSLGMKGVIVVGEDNVAEGTDIVGLDQLGGGGFNTAAAVGGAAAFGAVSLVGVAAYRELTGETGEY
jgi:halocyanin-like protein